MPTARSQPALTFPTVRRSSSRSEPFAPLLRRAGTARPTLVRRISGERPVRPAHDLDEDQARERGLVAITDYLRGRHLRLEGRLHRVRRLTAHRGRNNDREPDVESLVVARARADGPVTRDEAGTPRATR